MITELRLRNVIRGFIGSSEACSCYVFLLSGSANNWGSFFSANRPTQYKGATDWVHGKDGG